MNHQAAKLVHPVDEEQTSASSTAYDGILVLVFACPGCGWIDSRRADAESTA